MDEATLRREVLIPLFRAMGFRVVHYHGGALEQGKDFVMWRQGPEGHRENYAVVVKVQPITGQATGSGSAAEVHTQILQCFGSPFLDPTAPGKQDVARCYVVCPHEIKKEALQSLDSLLTASHLARAVKYIAGDELWNLIDKHLTERTLMAKASELSDVLRRIEKDLRVSVNLADDAIRMTLHEGTSGEPIEIKSVFAFPENETGRAAREEFERHIKTGQPVTIRQEHIAEWQVPEVLQRLGFGTPRELTIGPAATALRVLRVEMSSHIGTEVLSKVPFRAISGTEEATLTCEDPHLPFTFSLRFLPARKLVTLQMSTSDIASFNVKQQLDATRFFEAMVAGGTLRFAVEETGQTVVELHVESGVVGESQPHVVRILEALVTIQARTGALLSLPEGPLSREQLQRIARAKRAVEGESFEAVIGSLEVNLSATGIDTVLREAQAGTASSVAAITNDELDIFGVTVQLGTTVRHIERLRLAEGEEAKLRAAKGSGASSAKVTFCGPPEGAPVIVRYINWLPADEAAQYRQQLKLDQ